MTSTAPDGEQTPSQMERDVAALRADFDQIVPALVKALKENKYFDEVQGQLERASRTADALTNRPLVLGVHDVVEVLRADGVDPRMAAEQLMDVLFRTACVSEFGEVGDEVDPVDVEVQHATGEGPVVIVTAQHRPGLRTEHVIIRKALVSVERKGQL